MDTNFINVTNRGLTSADDFVSVGELQRTPAVIPSKVPGQEAVVIEAATAGSGGNAGAFDDLRAQLGGAAADCEPELSPHEQALRTNEEIEANNAQLDREIADLALQEQHLKTLFRNGLSTGDGVLTYGELIDLSMSSDPELAEAATWLMGAFEVRHALPRKGTLLGGDCDFEQTGFADGGGIDIRASQSYIAQLARRRRELEDQYQAPVEVPEATGAVGAVGGAGAAVSTGVMAANGSAGATAPWATSVGTASSLEEAIGHLADAMGGLEAELAQASRDCESSDPKVAAAAEKRMNELARRLQKLSAMMSMLNSTLSNIAKVYSEMAMTSVRNMK